WSLVQLPWSIFLGILGGVALGLLLVGLFQKLTLRDWEKLLLTLVASLLFWELSEFFSFAGLLGIMVMGLVLREKPTASAQKLEVQLSGIWLVAQIALFSLVGAEVNVGLLWQAGLLGLIVIVIGLLGRSVGVWVVLSSSNLNAKERIFCIISYLPKATVQAAIGGIPLSLGLASGELILAISALAILLTAPLGATGIRKSAPLLLEK
ncbi:MAG: sodium:proton antiporter, partial [Firmicutes bacterium]|nr:sodium:proton antiporter [Bacillota bacterium]